MTGSESRVGALFQRLATGPGGVRFVQRAKRVDTVPITRDYRTDTECARAGLQRLAA